MAKPAPKQQISDAADLARVMMSEASIGNQAEKTSVGWTVVNRMSRNGAAHVRGVWSAYSHSQAPTAAMLKLAQSIINNEVDDPTGGATHYYSPRTMPKKGDATDGYDVAGGLEKVDPLETENYRPGFASTFTSVDIPGVRPSYYKFYKAPGTGSVR